MKVLQLIDTLNAGGAERVAVNYANALSNSLESSYICATREEGLLKEFIDPSVGYMFLGKKSTLDFKAIRKLGAYVNKQDINIIHAHSSSFFMATLVKILYRKRLKIVWHDHYGNSEFLAKRKQRLLRYLSRFFDQIICVNHALLNWSKEHLNCENIDYLPNFASMNREIPAVTKLHGESGKRILCLANLRAQKDHVNLINAFKIVHKANPSWSLHLVGKDFNDNYSENIKTMIESSNLTSSIFVYGSKGDISAILEQSEIGVLSSRSEGLPVALLEYGLAGLSVVATNVGEIEAVITNNQHGLLIEPQNAQELSQAIIALIQDEVLRKKLAIGLQERINSEYSEFAVMERLMAIYKKLDSQTITE